MKQHISENQLKGLTYEQQEKLRYLWIPKENDLAVAYICQDAESEDLDVIPFTIGKVESEVYKAGRSYNSRTKHFSMLLRSLRLIDNDFYEEVDKPDDDIGELELEYKSPEDYFSFEYCLPLLNIGQMIEILSKHYFSGFDFFINYKTSENNYGIGKRMSTYGEQYIDYESPELCDALWEAVKSLL